MAPSDNGSPITTYRITLKQKDETFSVNLANCDGTSLVIVSSLTCLVPLDALTAAPYSLVFGDSVFAKVQATNYYGESQESDAGNGAIIQLVPSAPVNLADNVAVTTAYVIGFTWQDGTSTGGSDIIDYRISYD